MIEIEVPGFGELELEHLVTDYTGTLSVDGRLIKGVRERLETLSEFLEIHVLTSDTFGTAVKQLDGLDCKITILQGEGHDQQKDSYVASLGPESVVAMGNGMNDRMMLKRACLGIAVTDAEGCAIDAIKAADIHVRASVDGLDLLLHPKRCKATLRF